MQLLDDGEGAAADGEADCEADGELRGGFYKPVESYLKKAPRYGIRYGILAEIFYLYFVFLLA